MQRTMTEWNPMFLRCLRQELRSKAFLAAYLTALLVATLACLSTGLWVDDVHEEARIGLRLFGVLHLIWAFLILPARSFTCFRTVTEERQQDTWDLIELSGMSAQRVVRGWLFTGLAQAGLFSAALMPFLVMAWLLRGVDLAHILCCLVMTGLAGISVIAFATAAGTLAKRRFGRLGGGWLMHATAFSGFWILAVIGFETHASSEITQGLRSGSGEVWFGVSVALSSWAALTWLAFELAAAQLLHRSADRSTRPRLATLACAAVPCLACFLAYQWLPHASSDEMWGGMAICLALAGSLLALGALAEPKEISAMQAQVGQHWGRWRRWSAALLGPGSTRGARLVLVVDALAIVAGCMAVAARGSGEEMAMAAFAILGYQGLFIILFIAVLRRLFADRLSAPALRVIVVAAILLCSVLAPIFAAIASVMQRMDHHPLMLCGPITGVVLLCDDRQWEPLWWLVLLSLPGLGCLLAMARPGREQVGQLTASEEDTSRLGV